MERFGLAYCNGDSARIIIPYKNSTVRPSLLTCSADDQRKTIISKLRDFFFEFSDGRKQCVVNEKFISYPMKDGACRLINQNGVDKYKIANSTAKRFVDLSLSYAEDNLTTDEADNLGADNLLATLDESGIVSLWKVLSKECTYLLDLHFPPDEVVRRIILNRTRGSEFFVTVHHGFVRIWNLLSLRTVMNAQALPTPLGRKQPKLSIECTNTFFQQVSTKFSFSNFRALCWVTSHCLVIAGQDKVVILDITADSKEYPQPQLSERLSVPVSPDAEINSVNVLAGVGASVLIVGSDQDSTFNVYYLPPDRSESLRHLQTIRFRSNDGCKQPGLVSVNHAHEEEQDVLVLLQEQLSPNVAPNLKVATQQTILCMRLTPYSKTNWLPIQSMLKIACPDSSETLQTVTGMPNMRTEGQSIFFFLSHNRSMDMRGSVVYCQSVHHSEIPADSDTHPSPVADDAWDEHANFEDPLRIPSTESPGNDYYANGLDTCDDEAFTNLSSQLNQRLLHELNDVMNGEMEKSKQEASNEIVSVLQRAFDDKDQRMAKELAQAMAMVEEEANLCNGKVQDFQQEFAVYEQNVMKSTTESMRNTLANALDNLAPQLRRELDKVGNTIVDTIATEIANNKEFGDSLGQAQPAAIASLTIESLRPSKQMIRDTIQTVLPTIVDQTVSKYILVEMRNLFECTILVELEASLQQLVKRHNEESLEIVQAELIGPLTEEILSIQRSLQELQQRVESINAPRVDSLQQVINLFMEDKTDEAFLIAIKSQVSGVEDILTALCSKIPTEDIEPWLASGKLSDELKLFLALSLAKQLNSDGHRLSDEYIAIKIIWIREIAIYLLQTSATRDHSKTNTGVIKSVSEALASFKAGPRGALIEEREYKFLTRIVRALNTD